MLIAIARFLGLQLTGEVARRLPVTRSWGLVLALLLVANLSPVWMLTRGGWGVPDLLLFYGLENCLIVAATTLRLLHHGPRGSRTDWLDGGVYGMIAGIFTLVAMVFAGVSVGMHGLLGSASSWLLNVVVLLLSYGLMMLLWYRRDRASVDSAWGLTRLWVPTVPRLAAMHLFVILLSFQTFDGVPTVVWVMVWVKLAWDVVMLVIDVVVALRHQRRVAVA